MKPYYDDLMIYYGSKGYLYTPPKLTASSLNSRPAVYHGVKTADLELVQLLNPLHAVQVEPKPVDGDDGDNNPYGNSSTADISTCCSRSDCKISKS